MRIPHSSYNLITWLGRANKTVIKLCWWFSYFLLFNIKIIPFWVTQCNSGPFLWPLSTRKTLSISDGSPSMYWFSFTAISNLLFLSSSRWLVCFSDNISFIYTFSLYSSTVLKLLLSFMDNPFFLFLILKPPFL